MKQPFGNPERGKFDFSKYSFSTVLSENMKAFKRIFENDDMLRCRVCRNNYYHNIVCGVFFLDGMAKAELVNDSIIKPLVETNGAFTDKGDVLGEIYKSFVYAGEVKRTSDVEEIITSIIYGDTALMTEGCAEALIINSKGWETRSIAEPQNEKTLRGPHEGFCEGLLKNTALLRRRLKTPDLKFRTMNIGTRSKTMVCLCYLDNLVNRDVLKKLEKKLGEINIDGVLDVNYLDELTRDNKWTPLKTAGITERPDVVAGRLLEGRIAVMVDGSPSVMTVPYLFIENLQSDDDYYINFFFASMSRLLRIISLIITVAVPGLYVALTTFHREMIPTNLALSISQARQGVPLPIVVECLVMLLVFEILRESGVRMPSNVGTALSVVGAIVIGQAAVNAKFVSAPMVIVVSVTGITGLMVSKLKGAIIIYRTFLVLAASVLGMYGLIAGMVVIVAHTLSLTSFGVSYGAYLDSFRRENAKDIYVRLPWWQMITRPGIIAKNLIRQQKGGANG